MAHTYGNALATGNSAANPVVSATYTPTAGSTAVVLALFVQGSTNRAGSAPTFGGVTMSQANSTQKAASSPESSLELWYLAGPTLPTSGTFSIPNTGTATIYYSAASTIAGSQKTSAFDQANGANNTAANPSPGAVVTTVNGAAVFSAVAHGAQAWSPSAQSGTAIINTDIGSTGIGFQYTMQSTLGSITPSWTQASEDWGSVVVAFKEINAYSLSCDPGSYATTGSDATTARLLTTAAGSYATTGSDATLAYARPLSVDAGSYAVTGSDATLTYTSNPSEPATGFKNFVDGFWALGVWADGVWAVNARTLTCDAGAYAVTGSDATLNKIGALSFTGDPGAYDVTGSAATLQRHYILTADAGAYALTGADIAVLRTLILQADAGAYVITGTDATLDGYVLHGVNPRRTLRVPAKPALRVPPNRSVLS
jgi:hypothetical protein